MRSMSVLAFIGVLSLPMVQGCSHEDGALGGACYGNGTCNPGMVCNGTTCVEAEAEDATIDGGVTGDVVSECGVLGEGGLCNDGDPCTRLDQCVDGVCVGSDPDPCESEKSCMTAACVPFEGCTVEAAPDGTACEFTCFEQSECLGGSCVPNPDSMVVCAAPTAGDPCIEKFLCNASTGLCNDRVFATEGSTCDHDENLCTLEACDAFGECISDGAINDCAASSATDPCSFYLCNSKTGDCSASGFLGEISCDDGNPCTSGDTCHLDEFNYASCQGNPFSTNDGNPCTDDACVDGVITHTNIAGVACDPADLCSPTGACVDGACVPATPCECLNDADCPQGADSCLGVQICNATTGQCEVDPLTVVQCDPSELPCHTNECLPGFGTCVELTSPNGTTCTDGNACSSFDQCSAGACLGTPVVCNDDLFCNGLEVCDPAAGCVPGVAPLVDDGVGCTLDSCNEGSDVVNHAPDSLACDDGVFCNGPEACDPTFGCKSPEMAFGDDGVDCTVDSCDETTKTVSHQPDAGFCDSGNVCLVDACVLGIGCQTTAIPGCCGNGLIEAGEICDDANAINLDGCSDQCLDECMYTSVGTVGSLQKISATQGDFLGSLGDGDLFGGAVTGPGDIDGDGVRDMVVGMRLDDDGGSATGAVWVVFLNRDGSVKGQQKISDLKGDFLGVLDPADNFGSAVASIGDLNGDGVGDIVVGAMDDDDGGPSRGALWVLFLKADGKVKATKKISMASGGFNGLLNDGDAFGRSVAAIGDLDGDGVVDLAVGAPGCDDGGQDAGAVWILFLTPNGTVKHQQKIASGTGSFQGAIAKQDLFGTAVAALGDLNGDGVFDLAVAAPYADGDGWDKGEVWILHLNTDGTVNSESLLGDGSMGFDAIVGDDAYFGEALVSPGDLDANGTVDLVVGAPGTGDGGNAKGALWVVYLAPGPIVIGSQKIGVIEGGLSSPLEDGDFFGSALAAINVTDGSERTRLAVGAWGDDDGGIDKGAVTLIDLSHDCSICGNGITESWETCDDGNEQDADLCPNSCNDL